MPLCPLVVTSWAGLVQVELGEVEHRIAGQIAETHLKLTLAVGGIHPGAMLRVLSVSR